MTNPYGYTNTYIYTLVCIHLKHVSHHTCNNFNYNPYAYTNTYIYTILFNTLKTYFFFIFSFPSGDPLFQIYNSILSQHLSNPQNKFPNQVQKICSSLVNTALQLHARVGQMFLPTAVKFHYVFNLRDLANIFQVKLKPKFFLFIFSTQQKRFIFFKGNFIFKLRNMSRF